MSFLSAILLGIVQGIAEFLPISSSGHLAVLQNLFGVNDVTQSHLLFDVMLHLGTLISVIIAYRRDILEILRSLVGLITGKGGRSLTAEPYGPPRRFVLMIIVATLPLLLVFPVKDAIESLSGNTIYIGIILILTGVMLFAADRIKPGRKNEKNMTYLDALLIGFGQAVATVPGLSRSGTTISVGMARGLDREYAVKFSFIMSLPAILGANILTIGKAVKAGIDASVLPAYIAGVIVAAVVGLSAIKLVRLLAKKGKFGRFAYYCFAAGLAAIILALVL
ncbi:MAG: undecaprenyl-diphosphate phosphatase [Oscillospiraceae bacterium]|nr:undecaprenyl-diphosphate phosphatase [Oscillospiraceae bacterium]